MSGRHVAQHVTKTRAETYVATATCSCGWQRQFRCGLWTENRHAARAHRAADKHVREATRDH